MRPIPHSVVTRNRRLAVRLQTREMAAGTLSDRDAAAFCADLRVIGVSEFLRTGVSSHLIEYLSHSASAFAHYQRVATDPPRPTTLQAQLFDACACRNWALAASIVAGPRRGWDPTTEYEDDFRYSALVEAIVTWATTAEDGDEVRGGAEAALAQLEAVGDDGPRASVCEALVMRDAQAFDSSLREYMGALEDDWEERLEGGEVDPEASVTTDRLSVEGLGLASLAIKLGLSIAEDFVRVPSLARGTASDRFPDPSAWQVIGSEGLPSE